MKVFHRLGNGQDTKIQNSSSDIKNYQWVWIGFVRTDFPDLGEKPLIVNGMPNNTVRRGHHRNLFFLDEFARFPDNQIPENHN
jgi:hypothetical protein